MRGGFTLLEVMIAAIILGLGTTVIVASMSQSQRLMLAASSFETAQEVMDLGDMAYPLEEVKDENDLEVRETKATELWEMISDERLSDAQEEKFHGYTWERECLNLNDSDEDIARLGNLYVVRVTVRWGDRYVMFWRKPK